MASLQIAHQSIYHISLYQFLLLLKNQAKLQNHVYFFILKTNEPNKNKSSVIYDDVPKLLSEEEINKMVKEAEANKEADKKKRDSVDARNQADTLLHATEKNLKEHGAKVSEADSTLGVPTSTTFCADAFPIEMQNSY